MSNYFDQWPELTWIHQGDGRRVLASEALEGKDYLLLYFAPLWHGGTHRFTPKLKAFYEAQHKEKSFEVLYIARGATQAAIDQCFLDAPATGRPPVGVAATAPLLHGSYYALAEADMEAVAVPLLYHFRVFSYPSLMVLDNRPAVVAALRAKAGSTVPLLSARFSPLENSELQASVLAPASAPSSLSEEGRAVPPAQRQAGEGRKGVTVEYDSKGRRKYTPRIAMAAHVPRQLCLTGVFMLEKVDPTGEQFPWTTLGARAAAGRRTFLVFAILLLSVVSYFLVKVGVPGLLANNQARKQAARTRLAAAKQPSPS